MTEEKKIFLSKDYTAVMNCDRCQRSFQVDLYRFTKKPRQTRIRTKCPCGHTWTSVLEKRRYYRKPVNLPGTYKYNPGGRPAEKGIMTVVDISKEGLRLKFRKMPSPRLGDWLEVSFRLDDRNRTDLTKTVVVQNVCPPHIGVSFSPYEPEDRRIGFYLFG